MKLLTKEIEHQHIKKTMPSIDGITAVERYSSTV